MADFRKMALDLILADGTVDENEIKILKKYIKADDPDALQFLIELRAAAGRKAGEGGTQELDAYFLRAVGDIYGGAGSLSQDQLDTLKKSVINGKGLDPAEVKKVLARIKKGGQAGAGFDKMHEAFTKKHAQG